MARFFAFFTLFHLSLTFFRPEVPFKIRNVLIAFPNHLNVERFLTNRWCTRQFRIQIFRHHYIMYHIKNMASWEPDEIDFEDEYDKADPIDDVNLDESINELNRSILEQEKLQDKLSRTEWSPMNKDEISKLGQQIAFNEKKQGLYIMRASKTISSIFHKGFDKIKQGGRVMVSDEKSAEKLYNRLRLEKSDEGT